MNILDIGPIFYRISYQLQIRKLFSIMNVREIGVSDTLSLQKARGLGLGPHRPTFGCLANIPWVVGRAQHNSSTLNA